MKNSSPHKPLVSICIPTYNGAKYLSEAINSAIAQTYRPIEIVISDDNSTDGTIEIAERLKNESNIPFLIFKHTPEGIGANWNNAIKHSNGEFIKFLFQDDILRSDCIEQMMQLNFKNNNLGFIVCRRELIVESEEINQASYYQPTYTTIQSGKEILGGKNLFNAPRNKIGEPTCVLIPKAVIEDIGYFNTKLSQSLDYEFLYRVCHFYSFGYINKELVKFRLHNNQTTRKNSLQVVPDRYRIPITLLRNHFSLLHFNVKLLLFYKYLSGLTTWAGSKLITKFIQNK
ncbi:glycosyltransferase family 2 protein [Draconibacterium halophilum]|uniref:Glycosyltransferase n=1 Tax=Draconibacterium halophilum TaxID=2706887 RepID=A0A6C0RC79_9BACT|nr:glycosyltransferase [Draconibacterium halophilum]QIA06721.1 glycosyltransferase [Draconibacterium halophilum]